MIKLGEKLSLILLIICVLFSQRTIVYGQGVSIDFSSFSSGSIQITTQSWGNTNIPSSPPTTSTPITPSMPTSTIGTSSTSTYSSIQTQTINSGISSTSTNLNNLTSSYQKLNNSTSGQSGYYKSYVPTELNKELIRSVTFSPLSEKEPLLPDAEPYIITVCLPFNNMSVSGCFDKVNNSEQASEKLAGILLNRYFNGTVSRPFRVIFPLVMPIKEQKNSLHQIEIQAIAIVESRR